MANRRVLVKRRTSVRNIRKITRTMQLIATARFQKAFNRAVAMSCIVRVILRMLRTAWRRLTISRRLAILVPGGELA